MPVHVLVLVVFVDGHPHRAHFGQHDLAKTGLHHEVDAGDGIGAQKELVELGGHPFGGDPAQLRSHLHESLQHPRRRR